MTPSDSLFRLVKSLSKSEKGYFKKFSALHVRGNGNEYIRLFDAIVKQKTHQEGIPAGIFSSPENARKKLADTRLYLFQVLMRSLESYHSSVDTELKSMLHRIEILFDKGLGKECYKLIGKAKKMAVYHEKFLSVMEVMRWEERLMIARGDVKRLDREINSILEERLHILAIEKNIAEFRKLSSRMTSLVLRKGERIRNKKEGAEYEKIFRDPLFRKEERAISSEAKGYFYNVSAIYYYVKKDLDKSALYYQKILDLLEARKHQMLQDYSRNIYVLEYLMMILTRLKKFDALESLFEKLLKIPVTSLSDEARIFAVYSRRKLDLSITAGEFEKALPLVTQVEKGFERFGDIIEKAQRLLIMFNVVGVFFGAGQYKNALLWVNRIINDTEINLREDIYSFSQMMNLLIHYELRNNELLEYIIGSTYKVLSKKKKVYKFEQILISFIKDLFEANSRRSHLDLLVHFRREIEPLRSDPFEQTVFEYFDFVSWLDSKISGRKFAEVVKEKATSS